MARSGHRKMKPRELLWDIVTVVLAMAFYVSLWFAIPKDIRNELKRRARRTFRVRKEKQEERSRRRTSAEGAKKAAREALRRARRGGCPCCGSPRVDKYKEADKWVAECRRCDFRGIGYESKSELQAKLQQYNGN